MWHFAGSSAEEEVRKRLPSGSVTTAALRASSQPGTARVPGSAPARKPWSRKASLGRTPSRGAVRSTSRAPRVAEGAADGGADAPAEGGGAAGAEAGGGAAAAEDAAGGGTAAAVGCAAGG
ncbi:hypothetical protein ACFQFC_40300 [Amorphoplanes digitatis]|uniref:hypothetical protein n=1 Tax=Actinoplanes digitatis TaxID=1868 RepID=UPI00360610B8